MENGRPHQIHSYYIGMNSLRGDHYSVVRAIATLNWVKLALVPDLDSSQIDIAEGNNDFMDFAPLLLYQNGIMSIPGVFRTFSKNPSLISGLSLPDHREDRRRWHG